MADIKKTRTASRKSTVRHATDERARFSGSEVEARLQLVVKNTSDIITVFDRMGRILYQSPAIGRILGRDAAVRIGANIFDSALVHPDDQENKRLFLKRLIAAKPDTELKGDFRLRHVNGNYRDIEAIGINLLNDPALGAIILSSRDVTERRAAQRALAESEAKYALTFDKAPIGIAHTSPDGRFLLINQRLYEMLGYSRKQLLRKNFQSITHPDDVDDDIQAAKDLVTGKSDSYQCEKRYLRKDGSAIWVSLRVVPQRDSEGRVSHFIITVEDITQRKQAEASARARARAEAKAAALAEQHEQLITLGKAKDEFNLLASHQLRTPATGVKQYVGMLLEGYAGRLTRRQRDFLVKAYDSNERQLKIIETLLNVVNLDSGKVQLKPGRCNLTKLPAGILDDMRPVFEERRQVLSFDKPRAAVITRADADLLRTAIENLLDNAGKYSPAGRLVKLSLRRTPEHIEIAISDKGVGIAKRDQPKLFQKFSRIDNPLSIASGGSGLGLYWAKKIIDLHHGSIELVSRPHRGSIFTIVLPVA